MLMILARLVRSESFWAVVKVRSPHTGPEVCYIIKRLGRLSQHLGHTLAIMLNELLTLQVPEYETPRPANEAQKFRHRMLCVRRDRSRLVQLLCSHCRISNVLCLI